MRKLVLGFVVVAVVFVFFYLRLHRTKPPLGTMYAGNHEVTLWSTTAQIRSPIATAVFGDRLDVLGRYGDQVQVRTAAGRVGWTSADNLLSAELWQKAEDLEKTTSGLPVEAQGHTRVLSNLHLDPGRDTPRVRQLNKNIPVDLFERQPLPVPAPKSAPAATAAQAKDGEQIQPQETAEPRKEDWWLVRAHLPDKTSQSGWVLGRFIELDIPDPLPDYASSAGMHIAAWFELNRAADLSGSPKNQFLVVGNRGIEGQACDFTLLRVFTWGLQRQRYETAFVESDVCGRLPVRVTAPKTPGGDVTFAFQDWSKGPPEDRIYRVHQTIVRRVRQEGGTPAARKRGR